MTEQGLQGEDGAVDLQEMKLWSQQQRILMEQSPPSHVTSNALGNSLRLEQDRPFCKTLGGKKQLKSEDQEQGGWKMGTRETSSVCDSTMPTIAARLTPGD